MSNHNTQNHGNNNGTNGGANGQTPDKKQKKSFLQKLSDAKHKVQSTKAGRITVRCLKGLGVAGIGVGSFFLGRKTTKPTVVYVSPVEDDKEPEAQEPEPESEPVEEENT